MITTSTDVSVVATQLTGVSLLFLLGDMEAVITAPLLMAIVGVGMSQLIVSLAFLLSRPTLVVGIAYLLLALITNVRASIEEQMLDERYSEYAEHRRRTKRYIPFVV